MTQQILSLFRHKSGKFFSWEKDVDAVTAALASDTWQRTYYSEGGILKVTDKEIFKNGYTSGFPRQAYKAGVPAPTETPEIGALEFPLTVSIINQSCYEADGTYALVFSYGTGSGAAGTYTIVDHTITAISLTNRGSYSTAPLVKTQSGAGSLTAVLGDDPTLMETRGYVYTFVNGYGVEGPPSPVSDLVSCYDGDTVTISNLQTTVDSDYNITKKRLYRINQGSSDADYQYVAELDIGDASYVDTLEDSELGETLSSAEWDEAPNGIKGIISLPNGCLCGFVGEVLCFSEPYYPHAWPLAYQKVVDRPIMALGTFGTAVAVLTSGKPVFAVGSHPNNIVMETMDMGYSCMSKRGAVQAGDVVIYPSPEGLVAIGPQTNVVLTDILMTQDEWKARYNPASISGYYWDGHYVGFYKNGGKEAGFMLDIRSKQLVDLAFYASAGYREPGTGTLFLVVNR